MPKFCLLYNVISGLFLYKSYYYAVKEYRTIDSDSSS